MFGWVKHLRSRHLRLLTQHTGSFAVLSGPINHLKHLAAPERLPFSAAYIGSLIATLYFSVVVRAQPLLFMNEV